MYRPIEDWNNCFSWKEIDRLKEEKEQQYQAFQKWKKEYFVENKRLRRALETVINNFGDLKFIIYPNKELRTLDSICGFSKALSQEKTK